MEYGGNFITDQICSYLRIVSSILRSGEMSSFIAKFYQYKKELTVTSFSTLFLINVNS